MQIRQPDSYHSCFPARNTIQVNKEEEAVKTFMVFNYICHTVKCWALVLQRAPPLHNFTTLSNSFAHP